MPVDSGLVRALPFCLLGAVAIGYTPVASEFLLIDQQCDVDVSMNKLLMALTNVRHIVGYGVLTLAALPMFRRHAMVKSATLVLALSVLVELQQSVFVDGHCRWRDLIPNVIGIGAAMVLIRYAAPTLRRVRQATTRRQRKSRSTG